MKTININIKGIVRLSQEEYNTWSTASGKKPELFSSIKDLDQPGIYCWGFFHPKDDRFIPYYVGDSVGSLRGRLTKHIKDITTYTGSNYRRLKRDYFYGTRKDGLWFGIDKDFPLYVQKTKPQVLGQAYLNDKNWRKHNETDFDQKIFYWSDEKFIEKHFNKNKSDHSVISETKKKSKDVLYTGIINGNFGFMYWPVTSSGAKEIWTGDINAEIDKREFLEIFECFIKFSLKTKTGSNSISLELMRNRIDLLFGSGTRLLCKPEKNISMYFKDHCDSHTLNY